MKGLEIGEYFNSCEKTKNESKISSQLQWPSKPTKSPINTAAATPAVSKNRALVEAITKISITIEVIIKLP